MFIRPDNLNVINFEFTDFCNAACPMCSRFNENDGTLNTDRVNKNHTTLELLKRRIPENIIKQLKRVRSVGTYGDPVMNPEIIDIYEWIRDLNPTCRLEMHSNGGARDKEFWRKCGEVGIIVTFGIDGLEDTNHLYRRNVKWNKLIENVKAFIEAGGEAYWSFLIFKHNEHQLAQAEKLSKDLGFCDIMFQHTDRFKKSNWITGDLQDLDKWPVDDYFIEKPTTQPDPENRKETSPPLYEGKFNHERKIICQMASNNNYEVYIRATGVVQPCCMLGDIDVHESKRLIKDSKSVNLNHTDLVDILEGAYFKLLDKGINHGSSDRLKNCFYTCGAK